MVRLVYRTERAVERWPYAVRVAFDLVLDRLESDPEVDHLTIYDDLLTANPELRMYLDDRFLVTFLVNDDRILIVRAEHTFKE